MSPWLRVGRRSRERFSADGKTKGFIEPKGSRRRVRVKTKGFIKPLALGGSIGL